MNRLFGLLIIMALCAGTAMAAESYPSKPIEMVVVSSAGSGASLYAQTVSKILSETLKVPVNLSHKPSGNGNLACDYVKSKPADGYTIINWTSSMAGYMNFDHFKTSPDDFLYLCEMQKTVYCLAVPAESPFKTIQDLIDYAKKNPGKLDIGSSKMGNPQHINILNFASAAGIEVNYIPYNGTGETLKDVLGNHLSAGEIQPFMLIPHAQAGKIRILLTFNETRIPELPNVPVPADLGLNYPFYHQALGVVLKAGTPPERARILADALKKVMEHPEFKAYIGQSAGMMAAWKDTETFTTDFKRDFKNVGKVMHQYNLTSK